MLIAVIMAMIRLKQHPSMQFMSLGGDRALSPRQAALHQALVAKKQQVVQVCRGKPITLALSKGKGDVPLYGAVEQ